MKLPTKSIRWRLQLWYGTLLLLAIAGFCLVTLRLAWIDQTKRLDRQIEDKERMAVGTLLRVERKLNGSHHGRENDEGGSESENRQGQDRDGKKDKHAPFTPEVLELISSKSIDLPNEFIETFAGTESGYFYYIIADGDGNILLKSENAPENFVLSKLKDGEGWERMEYRKRFRESLRAAPWGIQSVFGKEITPELHDMRNFMLTLGSIAGAVWLLVLWGGWWIAGRAIRPVKQIGETAAEIAGGKLDQRIELEGTESELDQLGKVLNHTFDELQGAMERQRQFTADASHELRTPLTVILSESQRMLKKSRTEEEYRIALEVCQESGLRMKSLVEGLLMLARQEGGTVSIEKENCDLKSLVERCLREQGPLAEMRGIRMEADLNPVEAEVDVSGMIVVFNNLIGNSITHHPGNGHVKVTLTRTEDAMVEFAVEDDGAGIAAEHIDKIFERFYQIDSSRSNATEHSGLGLALVKTIAENHGGKCEVSSVVGKGSRFVVRFPAGK